MGSNAFVDMKFFSPNHGWLVRGDGIARAADGGASWQNVGLPSAITGFFSVSTVYAHDANTVSISHNSGTAYLTRDGGISWAALKAPPEH